MSTQQNKVTVVRLYQEVATGKNLDLVDELFTPDFAWQPSVPGKRSPEPLKRQLEQMHSIFTDIEFELHSVVAEGAEVAARATMTVTHVVTFMGIESPRGSGCRCA